MANRLEKRVELEYIPGIESQPAVPPRCVTITDVDRNPAETSVTIPKKGGGSDGKWVRVDVYMGSQSVHSVGRPRTAAEMEHQQRKPGAGAVSSAGSGQGTSYNGGAIEFGVEIPYISTSGPGVYVYVGGDAGTGRVNPNYERAYTSTTREVCYPGKPAVQGRAPQTMFNSIIGWNGGASSRQSIADGRGQYMRWRFSRSPVGIIVGMVSANSTDAFAEAEHGFYAHRSTVTPPSGIELPPGTDLSSFVVDVVEHGETIATVPGVDLSADPFFYITRSPSGVVTYSVPSVGFSLVSDQISVGRKVMDASIYASGDYVDDPMLGDYYSLDEERSDPLVPALATPLGVQGRVTRVRVTLRDGSSEDYGSTPGVAYVRTTLGLRARALASYNGEFLVPALTSTGIRARARARGEYNASVVSPLGVRVRVLYSVGLANQQAALPSIVGIGSDLSGYAAGRGVLPSIRASATEPAINITYAVHDAYIPSVTSLGVGYTGAYGTADVNLPATMAIGGDEHGYGAGKATLPPLYAFGEIGYSKPGEIGWLRYLLFHDLWARTPRVYADITDALQLGSTEWALTVSIVADWADALDLDDQWSLYRVLFRYLQDNLRLRSTIDDTERDLIQYALNLDTGGVARYAGYEFDGFATAGQVTYGWNKQGVYALGSDTDDGVPIDAQVDFGRLMHSDLKAKHIEGLFLGIHTDGQVYVRFRSPADGVERVYRARQRRDSSRVNVGRGLTARRWDFILEVVNASEVEIDSIEFIPGVSSRRWVK